MSQPATSPLDLILRRRSIVRLVAPGPDAAQLESLLQAAVTVPDHGQLRPYRFVVVTSEGRAAFGDALAAAVAEARPDVAPEVLDKTRSKPLAAPCQIVLIASPREHKIPEWEQVATAACAGYAITLAATALGLGSVWKSAGVLDGTALRQVLGLRDGERVLGWVHVGQPAEPDAPLLGRTPLDLEPFVSVLGADGRVAYADSTA